MNATNTEQANVGSQFMPAMLQTAVSNRESTQQRGKFARAAELGQRRAGYGLPCSNCGAYYMADEMTCPICRSAERVSPVTNAAARRSRIPGAAPNAQLAARLQIKTADGHCNGKDHQGEHETAEICRDCYECLRERVDAMESALALDLQEAARIVYDAVWSDPSDPGKTYRNAALALLTELRRRSSMTRSRMRFPDMNQNSELSEQEEGRLRRCKALLRSQ